MSNPFIWDNLKVWLACFVVYSPMGGCASSPAPSSAPPSMQTESAEKAAASFDAVLTTAVKGENVDYGALVGNAELKTYLRWLENADLESMPTKEARLAFYINAYNALTLSSVLEYWPNIESVANVVPAFGFFKTKKHRVAKQSVTLDELENRIIRSEFKDPRIHAALNCASRSCPPLSSFAFQASKLNRQLDDVFRRFANDTKRNHINIHDGTVSISKIFSWYSDDFKEAGGAAAFLSRYIGDLRKKMLLKNVKTIQYLPYDWSLNKP